MNNSEAKIIFLLAGSVRPVKNPVYLLDALSGQFCEGVEGGVGGTLYQGGGWGGGNSTAGSGDSAVVEQQTHD